MTRPTRVLFVDEPAVLRSLDRVLRARRVPWETRFVDTAAQALAVLAAEPFDVVVADLEIRDGGGVDLLAEVRRAYPHIARLVTSGARSGDQCLRVMRVAHRFLPKPCDTEVLRHVVQRLAWGRQLADAEGVADAGGLVSLPTPPVRYLAVTAAVRRGAGLAEIARIIDDDPAVTARLLACASAGFFHRQVPVTTVADALAVLGTDLVRDLLLEVELFRRHDGSPAEIAALEALQRHSGFVARLAHALAPPALRGAAFTAGVIHDFGVLVKAALGRTSGDHAQIGGFVLGLWGIAEPIIEAVAGHHEPGGVPDGDAALVDTLHLAELIAEECEAAEAGRRDHAVISPAWLARNDASRLDQARALARAVRTGR